MSTIATVAALSSRQRRKLRELEGALLCFEEHDEPPLRALLPEITRFVDGGKAMVLEMSIGDDGRARLDDVYSGVGVDAEGVLTRTRALLAATPVGFSTWDPVVPNPRDRNRAVVVSELIQRHELERLPMYREVFCPSGLRDHDTLRVLVCDGPSAVAGVAFLRDPRFDVREAQLLGTIAPAVRRRLVLERRLGTASISQRRLAAVLEQLGAPAFIVSATGAVLLANTAGVAILENDASELFDVDDDVQVLLERAAKLRDDSHFRLTPIVQRAAPTEYLAIAHATTRNPRWRARIIARRWGLTSKQTEVLALAARGLANKTIAAHLRCAEVTIELHMTALLTRSECESRAELVARFWTEPLD